MTYTYNICEQQRITLRVAMNTRWHIFEERTPPEEVILLVYGPLGIDLAVNIENNLFFKKGDDWTPKNLEHWANNRPTHWAALTLPDEGSDFSKIALVTSGEPSLIKDVFATPLMASRGSFIHE
ncbi:MAG: hypothetical protein ACN4GW_21140 [Desulforhopalus sp.]